MNKKSTLFIIIFFFGVGFLTHAFFFPTVLTNNLNIFAKKSLQQKGVPPPAVESPNKALTLVSYEEGEFDPQVVVVEKSYYLGITNKSNKELMTLTSENPLFRTPRGYGESEQHLIQLYDVGEYMVSSLQHPDHTLKVIVK